jgi:hypothetical protein
LVRAAIFLRVSWSSANRRGFWSALRPTERIVELKAIGNNDRRADKSGEIADGEDGIDVTVLAEDEIIDPPTVSVFIDDVVLALGFQHGSLGKFVRLEFA